MSTGWDAATEIFRHPSEAKNYSGIARVAADIVAIFRGVYEAVKAVLTIVVGAVVGAGMAIWEALQVIGNFFMDIWHRISTPVLNLVKGLWDQITDFFAAGWRVLQGLSEIISGIFEGDWGRVWTGIKNVFKGIWDEIMAVLGLALEVIKGAIGIAMGVISTVWGYTWGLIKTVVVGAWDIIKAVFGKLYDWLVSPVVDAVSAVWGWISGVFGNLVSFVGELPGKIRDAASGIWDGLKGGLVSVVNWCIDRLNSLASPINSILGVLPGGFSIPKIPHIAAKNGAIVDSPTLALIGERKGGNATEVVFPAADPKRGCDLLRQAGVPPESSGGKTTTINNYITALDPRDASRQWSRRMAWDMKTAGL